MAAVKSAHIARCRKSRACLQEKWLPEITIVLVLTVLWRVLSVMVATSEFVTAAVTTASYQTSLQSGSSSMS